MRYIKSLLLLAVSALAAFSCAKEQQMEVKPEAPVIGSAQLRGLNGETTVIAGNPVKFSAEVNVKGSNLEKFSLEIKRAGEILASASFDLEGTSAHVEKEFDLPVSPLTLDAPFTPEVSMKVTNTDGMFTEKTLENENNVQITIPELFDALYLVDNNGKVWTMPATAVKGDYRTDGDLAEIGTSFNIATKLNSDNTIDPSGDVWEFTTPNAGEYGLKWIGFDFFTEQLSKMIDKTIVLDFSKMAKFDDNHYAYWAFELVQDCRTVFLNYPDGMLLQSDRFADIDANTARYTGHTGQAFEIHYVVDSKWLIVKEQYIATNVLWLTGMNASLPMTPYTEAHPLNWFTSGTEECCGTASCVRTGEGKFQVLLYLKEKFAFKVYDGWSWGNEQQWTSTTPETMVISPMETDPETGKTDGNYANAGASFTEGLYMFSFNKATREASLEKYNGIVLDGMQTGNADPNPGPTPEPEPEPEPEPGPEPTPDITLDKAGMGDNGDGRLVRWVLQLEQNCTVKFENFDNEIGKMVNLAIFDNIDENAKTARYTGVTEQYEVWYLTEQKWLIFTNNICAEKYLLIGKNCSFPQAPYTEWPMIESDIQPAKGQGLPLNKVADGIFRSYIYLADNYGIHLYAGNAWGNYVKEWTSGSPDLLVAHSESGLYYGTQNIDKPFTAGVYLIEYNKTDNKITISK